MPTLLRQPPHRHTDMTHALQVIAFAQAEVARLTEVQDKILTEEGPESTLLLPLYERLDELDPDTFEQRAGAILWGLGFDKKMMAKATKDMSGGWRMRVALARALFVAPTLLLLDEPTNHLDLETCVWLEQYLATYPKILLLVSHSQDFLNGKSGGLPRCLVVPVTAPPSRPATGVADVPLVGRRRDVHKHFAPHPEEEAGSLRRQLCLVRQDAGGEGDKPAKGV